MAGLDPAIHGFGSSSWKQRALAPRTLTGPVCRKGRAMSPRGLTMRRLTSEDADTLLSALITLAPVLELQGQASPTALAALLARPDAYVVAAFAGERLRVWLRPCHALARARCRPRLSLRRGGRRPHRGQGIGTAPSRACSTAARRRHHTGLGRDRNRQLPRAQDFEKAGGTRAGGPYMEYAFDL